MRWTKDYYRKYNVGDWTYGSPKIYAYGCPPAPLSIGKFCSIDDTVTILLNGEHTTNTISTWPFERFLPGDALPRFVPAYSKGPVVVGHDVWIGYRVVILSGVTIGHGAVIGAGAVVCSSIPPYAIVGGVPAKVIKYRFEQEQRKMLLNIAWWDWPIDKIRHYSSVLKQGDVEALVGCEWPIRKE